MLWKSVAQSLLLLRKSLRKWYWGKYTNLELNTSKRVHKLCLQYWCWWQIEFCLSLEEKCLWMIKKTQILNFFRSFSYLSHHSKRVDPIYILFFLKPHYFSFTFPSMQQYCEHHPLKPVCCRIHYHCAYANLEVKGNNWKCNISSVQKKVVRWSK